MESRGILRKLDMDSSCNTIFKKKVNLFCLSRSICYGAEKVEEIGITVFKYSLKSVFF